MEHFDARPCLVCKSYDNYVVMTPTDKFSQVFLTYISKNPAKHLKTSVI